MFGFRNSVDYFLANQRLRKHTSLITSVLGKFFNRSNVSTRRLGKCKTVSFHRSRAVLLYEYCVPVNRF